MSQFFSRCRHLDVHWINSHTCQCAGCGKTGHWFEKEGLVMWVRNHANKEHLKTTAEIRVHGRTVANNSLSSKAG